MESLDAMPEGVQLVQDLSSTPPGKFLELGVDALITDRCFRGGGARKRAWEEIGGGCLAETPLRRWSGSPLTGEPCHKPRGSLYGVSVHT